MIRLSIGQVFAVVVSVFAEVILNSMLGLSFPKFCLWLPLLLAIAHDRSYIVSLLFVVLAGALWDSLTVLSLPQALSDELGALIVKPVGTLVWGSGIYLIGVIVLLQHILKFLFEERGFITQGSVYAGLIFIYLLLDYSLLVFVRGHWDLGFELGVKLLITALFGGGMTALFILLNQKAMKVLRAKPRKF